MEYVKKTSIMYVIVFWIIGLGYWFVSNVSSWDKVSWPVMLVIFLVFFLTMLISMALLITSLLKGWRNYRTHNKDAKISTFLFSETPVSFEDERTRQINQTASRKSYAYAESLVALLVVAALFSGVRLISIDLIVFSALIVFSVRSLSYWLIWRSEYLK